MACHTKEAAARKAAEAKAAAADFAGALQDSYGRRG